MARFLPSDLRTVILSYLPLTYIQVAIDQGLFLTEAQYKSLLQLRYHFTVDQINELYNVVNQSLFPDETYVRCATLTGELGYNQDLYISPVLALINAIRSSSDHTFIIDCLFKTNFEESTNLIWPCFYHAIKTNNISAISLLSSYFSKRFALTDVGFYAINDFWTPARTRFLAQIHIEIRNLNHDILYFKDLDPLANILADASFLRLQAWILANPDMTEISQLVLIAVGRLITAELIENVRQIKLLVLSQFKPSLYRDLYLANCDVLLNNPVDFTIEAKYEHIWNVSLDEHKYHLCGQTLSVCNYEAFSVLLKIIFGLQWESMDENITMSEVLYSPVEVVDHINSLNNVKEFKSTIDNIRLLYYSAFLSGKLYQVINQPLIGARYFSILEKLRRSKHPLTANTFDELFTIYRHYPDEVIQFRPLNQFAITTMYNYLTNNGMVKPVTWEIREMQDKRGTEAIINDANALSAKLSAI